MPWAIILVGLALALALVLVARLLIASRRHAPSRRKRRPARSETAAGDAKSAPLEPTSSTTPNGDHEAVARTNGTQIHTNGHRAKASAAGIGNGANSRLSRGQADDLPEPAETARAFNLGQQIAGQGGMVEAHAANGHADQRGHGTAASNLGRLLEEQGALAEAEAAYRRADELGDSAGAFHLGLLLEGQGGVVEAQAAYGRADQRGHGTAASNLGRLLEEQGALAEAEAAYRRADERGDADGAFGLGVLLRERGALNEAAAAFERASGRGHNAAALDLGILSRSMGRGRSRGRVQARGRTRRCDRGVQSRRSARGARALAEAEAAYRRADERGMPTVRSGSRCCSRSKGHSIRPRPHTVARPVAATTPPPVELGVLLAEQGALAEAEAAFRRADERGDAVAAFNLGVLLEDRGAQAEAEAAYVRARQRSDGEVAKMARAALLDFGQQVEATSARRANERRMPRSRLVRRSIRAADQALMVSMPLEPATPIDGETGLGDAANRPRPITARGGGPLHQLRVEDVDPRRLRLLLEIDRTGSISAAAKRCAIGQPSASMHLRTLETAVGQRLVIRNGRGSELTAAGKIVATHAVRMLGTLESMRWALDALNSPSMGELAVAASHP